MENLTKRQQEVLDFIREFMAEHNMPPTRVEIAKELGFRSANSSEEHLKALARKGAIELTPGASRGIRLPESAGLPIIGRVAAGQPILAQANVEDHVQIPPNFFHPSADYMLRVHGESMREVGIMDGDLVAIHSTPDAANGQIVVARLEDEVTVKRFKRNRHQVQLIAENKDFSPIEVDLRHEQLDIEGIVVGVIRQGEC